jgi:hypothetical protein
LRRKYHQQPPTDLSFKHAFVVDFSINQNIDNNTWLQRMF